MINVVSFEVDSATLRMAEDGLRALTDAIGPMMMGYSKGDANQKNEEEAARTAAKYCAIGSEACHLLADCLEKLERMETENG